MKLHYGAVPEATDFQPEQAGWHSIREPGPMALQLIALPVALAILVLIGALLWLCLPQRFFAPTQVDADTFGITIPLIPILIIFVLLIPIHELIHALFQPAWGFSGKTVIGIWLTRGLVYAHYEGAMSRNRFLMVFAAPFIILSLFPLGILAIAKALSLSLSADWLMILAMVSLFGGVFAAGDFVGFFVILLQIPGAARVRNKGWRSYWQPIEKA